MMKRFLAVTAIVACLGALAVPTFAAATTKKTTRKTAKAKVAPKAPEPPKVVVLGNVGGKIKTADAKPVAGATVTLLDEKKQPFVGRSDSNGEFHISAPEGTYEVIIAAPHLAAAIRQPITIVVHGNQETWANLSMNPAP